MTYYTVGRFVEKIKSDWKSGKRLVPMIYITIIGLPILASLSAIIYYGFQIYDHFYPSVVSPMATSTAQNNSVNLGGDNSGAISIGDNSMAIVNVNKETGYTWINKDSWEATTSTDSQTCGEGCNYLVRLNFRASGSVIPPLSCMYVKTDTYIISFAYNLWAPDKNVSDYFYKNNLKSGYVCFGEDIGMTPKIRLGFIEKPTTINAEIMNCKDLPNDVIMPEGCK